jgi:hypothetical protein
LTGSTPLADTTNSAGNASTTFAGAGDPGGSAGRGAGNRGWPPVVATVRVRRLSGVGIGWRGSPC